MKTVPVMEVRRHLGVMLDEVMLRCETIIIERAGRPMAMLSPLNAGNAAGGDIALRLRAVERLAGLGGVTERGRRADDWVDNERAAWDSQR
jgi:antitoxin (DNA-binding transcriptional repressor) of toxin-antitoxin stability system